MHRTITRRDFVNGVAVGIGALGVGSRLHAASTFTQDQPGYYPPTKMGMRGSHDGSYDYAHPLRDGNFWKTASKPVDTKETFDLVVVGAGISGLAAAYYYRKAKPNAKILILDNHDDFGGHAKRNEFQIGGRTLITNGGTQGISSPFDYSKEARELMTDIGIEPQKLSAASNEIADRTIFAGLQNSTFFDKETFGQDRLVIGSPAGRGRNGNAAPAGVSLKEWLAKTPLTARMQADILRVEEDDVDYMPGLTSAQKKDLLSRISYKDFLLNYVKVDPSVIPYYQKRTHGLYGLGIDAVGALEVWPNYPGLAGLKIDPGPHPRMSITALGRHVPKTGPYNYHFPDGNASVARILLRKLIPGIAPGTTAESVVTAKFDYSKLDQAANAVRVRLSNTVLKVQHRGKVASAKEVDIVYGREKQLYSVKAKNVVMACWNGMVPYVCDDLPAAQKDALKYGVKVPLCYIAIGLRNWEAWQKVGIRSASAPGMLIQGISLESPTRIGDYRPETKSPQDPVLVRTGYEPNQPGLPSRDQHRAGHGQLLAMPFSTFEREIRDQMVRVLGSGGFDPARDIEAITVNRWPHGYAYEYNYLWDAEFKKGESPCELGRKRFGRISIANSDASAAAYTDYAIDNAYRAVQEQLAL
ncbi:MAG: NAD(P)-binding protein [Steroidobacteraceae bacterium]